MRISEHCRYRWYEISKIYTGVHGGLCDPSFWEVGVNEDVLKMKVQWVLRSDADCFLAEPIITTPLANKHQKFMIDAKPLS